MGIRRHGRRGTEITATAAYADPNRTPSTNLKSL
jgi:hypothetical protein